MSYSISIYPQIQITPALSGDQSEYLRLWLQRLNKLSMCHDMSKLNAYLTGSLSYTERSLEGLREAVGLPLGDQGEFYIGTHEKSRQPRQKGLPEGVPVEWCSWAVGDAGATLRYDGEYFGFDRDIKWLQYLTENFLSRFGVQMEGTIEYSGEEPGDGGVIHIKGAQIETVENVNPGPSWDRKWQEVS